MENVPLKKAKAIWLHSPHSISHKPAHMAIRQDNIKRNGTDVFIMAVLPGDRVEPVLMKTKNSIFFPFSYSMMIYLYVFFRNSVSVLDFCNY
jgi:hypothetical protein